MSPKPLPETISYILAQVCRTHRGYASVLLADLGLYVGQEMVLLHLWQEDGLTLSQLAYRLAVQPPTVTKMLERMHKVGLLECRKDAQDHRVSRVYLLDLGRKLQKSVEGIWDVLEERTLADFNLEERVLLRRLLLQLQANLTKS